MVKENTHSSYFTPQNKNFSTLAKVKFMAQEMLFMVRKEMVENVVFSIPQLNFSQIHQRSVQSYYSENIVFSSPFKILNRNKFFCLEIDVFGIIAKANQLFKFGGLLLVIIYKKLYRAFNIILFNIINLLNVLLVIPEISINRLLTYTKVNKVIRI